MPEEFLDTVVINFDKVIVHGRIADVYDENRFRKTKEIEQVLTKEQVSQLEELYYEQNVTLQKLLKSFVK